MFKRCLSAALLAALAVVTGSGAGGCGGPDASLDVTVVAAGTGGLPVANATVTLKQGTQTVATGTTNASGVATFDLDPGRYTVAASSATAGYGEDSQDVALKRGGNTVQLTLPFTAPALVFHTFTGSTANPTAQVASVQVSLGGQSVFTGSTTDVGNRGFDAVIVPNLKPSTTYTYTVAASGFEGVIGSATMKADATVVEVDVLLTPVVLTPPVPVEVQTSVPDPNVPGATMGSAAVVTITAPDGTVTTVTTLNPPPGPNNPGYDAASPPTVPLAPSTTYQYSALFTQYGGFPGNPVTGSFTTPAASAGSGPFVVPIVYDPSAGRTSGTPSKALP